MSLKNIIIQKKQQYNLTNYKKAGKTTVADQVPASKLKKSNIKNNNLNIIKTKQLKAI